jgi:hypothetical protein
MEPGLPVDRKAVAGYRSIKSTDPPVPPALITWDRERHFGSKHEPLVETSGQSSEKLALGDVPYRVDSRVRPNPNLEANDSADSRELPDAHIRDEATLDAHNLRRRSTYFGPDETKRQAGSDSSVPELVADHHQVVVYEARRSVGRSLAGRHARSVLTCPYLTLNPVSSRTCLMARIS